MADDRTLTVNIKLDTDDGNQTTAQDITRAVKDAEKQVAQSAAAMTTVHERSKKAHEKTAASILDQIKAESVARSGAANSASRSADAMVSAANRVEAAQRRVTAAVTANQELTNRINSGQDVDYSQAARTVQELGDAYGELTEAETELAKVQESVNAQQAASTEHNKDAKAALNDMRQAMGGLQTAATHLARSWVLLLVSEKDSAKEALQLVAKFEAVAFAINGTIRLIAEANRLWKAYRTLTLAAAGANLAFAGSSVAGGAATGTALGAGVIRNGVLSFGAGVAGGAVGRGGLGLASRLALGAGAAAGPGLIGAGALGVGAAAYELGSGTYGQPGTFTGTAAGFVNRGLEGIGLFSGAQRGADSAADSLALRRFQRDRNYFRFDRIDRLNQQGAVFDAGAGLGGLDRIAAQNQAAIDATSSRVNRVEAGETIIGGQAFADAMKQREGDLQNLIDLEKEKHQIAIQTAQASIQSAQDELALTRNKISLLEQERDLLQSEASRFARLSPVDQAATVAAAAKAARGGELTSRELDRLRGFSGQQDIVDAADLREAIERGAGQNLIDLAGLQDRNQQINTLEIKADAQAKLVVSLEDGLPDLIADGQAQMESIVRELFDELKRSFVDREEFQELINQQNARNGQ